MSIRRRVLITGATGSVGPAVVKAFRDDGFFVRTYSLDPPREGMFPKDVEVISGDVTDREGVAFAVTEMDYVIHMAALLHIDDPPPALNARYDWINVGGTANIVEACVRQNVRRIVHFSTIAVYGPNRGSVHSEETSPNPAGYYAKTKLEAERIVLAAEGTEGQPLGTVLRLAAVYGPGIKGNYLRLAQAIARKRFISIGDGYNRRTLVFERDVAAATVLAALSSGAERRIFNVTDGQVHTMKEILEVLFWLLGRRPQKITVPVWLARSAAGVAEFGAKRIGRRPSFTRAAVNTFTGDMAVSGDRIQKELGFTPEYGLERGWAEVISVMRRNGEI